MAAQLKNNLRWRKKLWARLALQSSGRNWSAQLESVKSLLVPSCFGD
jgi:hypothetical protein